MRPLARILLVLALVAASPHAVFTARVVKVSDGDSLSVAVAGKRPQKLRLVDIDTPELAQPYGREARQALADLVSERAVRVESEGSDDYGRLLARVFVGGLDVNAELVRSGAAWVYRKYSDDRALLALEREARAQQRGLWALPRSERIPPWQWRHGPSQREQAIAPRTGGFRCGEKKYCREMTSCAEARFHLEHCGATGLDGDGDGTPCAALCAH